MNNITKKQLSPKLREELLRALKDRFEKNMNRHTGLEWAKVQAKLEANPEKLWSLSEMQSTGGEPRNIAKSVRASCAILQKPLAGQPGVFAVGAVNAQSRLPGLGVAVVLMAAVHHKPSLPRSISYTKCTDSAASGHGKDAMQSQGIGEVL